MKPESLIFLKAKNLLPAKSEKTILFAGITNTSYEVFFYSFFGGKSKQCFAMAKEGLYDEKELMATFSEIVKIIKESKLYAAGQYNVATIAFENSKVKLDVEHYDMSASELDIKKAWKQKHIFA